MIIYRSLYIQIVGNPKHGIVKGYGAGVKPSTLFGMAKGCSARCREERRKEAEEFEARLDARVNATVPAIVQTVLQSLGITPPPNLRVIFYFTICYKFVYDSKYIVLWIISALSSAC